MTDEWLEHVLYPVMVLLIFAMLMAAIQNFKFSEEGWRPRCFNGIERRIMFRPVQVPLNRKKLFEFGDAIVATQPFLDLRTDVINLANTSTSGGGMLVVCAPFGQGKTTTAMGIALARSESMPSRVLCVATETARMTSTQWFASLKKVLGIDPTRTPADTVGDIHGPLMDPWICTHDTKRLSIAYGFKFPADPAPFHDYSMLVLDDFSPKELVNMNDADYTVLQAAIDDDTYSFLSALATGAHGSGLVVVVTTQCKNTLRLLHNGINGGSKCKMAPSTSKVDELDPALVNVDHNIGLKWTPMAREVLFTNKYPLQHVTSPLSEEAYAAQIREFAAGDQDIRTCCEQLYRQGGKSFKVFPTWSDDLRDYITLPVQRLLSCDLFCDDNAGETEVEASYQEMV
jgi:hypothetical protein